MLSIDKLSSTGTTQPANKEASGSVEKKEDETAAENWNDLFIKKGGLRTLYDIMMSGKFSIGIS